MTDTITLPQERLRLLGTILLIVACCGILLGIITAATVPMLHSFDGSWEAEMDQVDPEIADSVKEVVTEVLLPEGITMETTVRELMEYDRTFFDENRIWFQVASFLSTAFIVVFAVICLRLALSWRKGLPFGRPTILGLRFLGLLLVLQYFVGWIAIVAPEAWHTEIFFWSDLYQSTVEWLISGGPILSSGILFLILSWVVDYGRKIKEEQALTI